MAFENPVALYYSKVSRHYGLPIGKPSTWVANPFTTLRVRYLSPDSLKYSRPSLLGSPAILRSCCMPRSQAEGRRALSLQSMESRHNGEQW